MYRLKAAVACSLIVATAAILSSCGGGGTTILASFIYFQTNRDGQFEIYRMGFGGGSLTRLTMSDPDTSSANPAIFRDGSRVVFSRFVFTPPISIDSGESAGGQADLMRMESDGTGMTTLADGSPTGGNPGLNLYPTVNPAGDRIAWSWDGEIWDMDIDGTNQGVLFGSGNAFDPSYSPDGMQIVFSDSGDIWVMDAGGTNPVNLTQTGGVTEDDPSWSPDGNFIIFESDSDGGNEIWIMQSNGTNPVQITDNDADNQDPVFSPDGLTILWYTDLSGNDEVWSMNSDGTNPVNLSNNGGADRRPATTSGA